MISDDARTAWARALHRSVVRLPGRPAPAPLEVGEDIEVLERHADALSAANARLRLIQVRLELGQADEAAQLCAGMVEALVPATPTTLRSRWVALRWLCQAAGARRNAPGSLVPDLEGADSDIDVFAAFFEWVARSERSRARPDRDGWVALASRARAAGWVGLETRIWLTLSALSLEAGQMEDARAALEEASEAARSVDDRESEAWCWLLEAELAWREGQGWRAWGWRRRAAAHWRDSEGEGGRWCRRMAAERPWWKCLWRQWRGPGDASRQLPAGIPKAGNSGQG